MSGGFTRRQYAIVTADTGTVDIGMTNRSHRYRLPRYRTRLMTRCAVIGGRQMVLRFTAGYHAVMTIKTNAEHLRVINSTSCHRFPACREFLMTGITNIGGGDMDRCFSGGFDTIVAADAISTETAVINRRGYPGRGGMTEIALFRGDNMPYFLATGDDAIMATTADTDHFRMIDGARRDTQPGRRWHTMTGGTVIAAGYMLRRFTRSDDAIMAINTVTHDIVMTYPSGRFPCLRWYAMTGGAIIVSVQVIAGFAAGDSCVMTVNTSADDLTMVHRRLRHRFPGYRPRLMTGGTGIAAINVTGQFARCHDTVVTGHTTT